jgi:hypothetical protein
VTLDSPDLISPVLNQLAVHTVTGPNGTADDQCYTLTRTGGRAAPKRYTVSGPRRTIISDA